MINPNPQIKAFCDAGLYLLPIPPRDGKPSKAPRAGWNHPRTNENRNGYSDKAPDFANCTGDNFGLYHGASGTLALDLDNLELAQKIFDEVTDLALPDWLKNDARAEIKSPKANRGKLLFKLPIGFIHAGLRQLKYRKKVIFELRSGNCQDVIYGQHPEGGNYEFIGNPANNNAANVISNLLGVSGGTNQNQGAKAFDLVGLLSQSLEQIDESKEVEIGRQLASVLLGAKPLHPNTALQRYVNRLGRWISLQSNRPDLPWTFGVLDDVGYNAFATPGGYIFITKGLVDHVTDEAELAGILAHEITHVISKHHLQAIRKSAQSGVLTKFAASQLKSDLGGAVSAQLLGLGRELYSKGLDQEDELEADRNGVALATRAGFDPFGLVAALQQLRTEAPDNPLFTLSFSTHPPAQVRLDQMELAMGQRLDAFTGKQQSVTVAQRLARSGNR